MAWSFFGSNRKKYKEDDDKRDLIVNSRFNNPYIKKEDAMQIPAFSAALNIIVNTVSYLPIKLYEIEENDTQQVFDHKSLRLLEYPNFMNDRRGFLSKIVEDLVLYGSSYVLKDNGELQVLSARRMKEELHTSNGVTISEIKYLYNSYKGEKEIPRDDLLIVKCGNGVLENTDILNLARNEIAYTSNILENGALPIGVLKAQSKLTKQAFDRLRESFSNLYGGAKKSGKTIILEEGLDYSPISMKPNDLQLTESKKNTISEIARIFNIPEEFLNTSANKYGSLELKNLSFLNQTIAPILTAIEKAFDKELLGRNEKKKLHLSFDTSQMTKLSEKETIENSVALFNNSILDYNQTLAKLNLPLVSEEKNFTKLNLGSVLLYSNGDIFTPNTGQIIDPNNPITNEDEATQVAINK
ncbi:phage portal protein [Bacillus anthracis]|nr:phage portal protein [Bacillus anthracis]PFR03837.1 phage portal protein [Bacillus anthracis]